MDLEVGRVDRIGQDRVDGLGAGPYDLGPFQVSALLLERGLVGRLQVRDLVLVLDRLDELDRIVRSDLRRGDLFRGRGLVNRGLAHLGQVVEGLGLLGDGAENGIPFG